MKINFVLTLDVHLVLLSTRLTCVATGHGSCHPALTKENTPLIPRLLRLLPAKDPADLVDSAATADLAVLETVMEVADLAAPAVLLAVLD